MNERIKKLAKKSGMSFVYEYDSSVVVHVEDLQKFAELLIEECFYACIDDGDIHGSIYLERLNTYFGTKI